MTLSEMTRSAGRVAHDMGRSLRDPELRGLFVFSAVILIVGTGFYMWAERWDVLQALYFCVTTLTTVGYGDLHPSSDLSRAFTIVYVLVGVGIMLGLLTVVARQATKPVADRIERREKHIEEELKHE